MSGLRAVQLTFTLLLLALLIAAISCSENPPYAPDPHAPLPPSRPFPQDRAGEQAVTPTLRWSCSDPDGDSLTYSVYFGTALPVPLVDSAVTDTTFDPGLLALNRVYYWRVEAHDPEGRSTGSTIWSFTTRAAFFYPLAVGNRWEYAGEYVSFNFRPRRLSGYSFPDTIHSSSVVEVTRRQDWLDSIAIYVFDETFVIEDVRPGNDTFRAESFFAEAEDGLYYYGNSGSVVTGAVPKIRPEGFISFQGRRFNSVQEIFGLLSTGLDVVAKSSDPPIYEDSPRKSLQYPLKVGSQWVYLEAGDPWLAYKRVTSRQTVDVPAGGFDCFEIQLLNDWDEDGQWDEDIEFFDYISDIGLVRRSITARGLVMLDENGVILGTIDAKTEFVLTGYQVE